MLKRGVVPKFKRGQGGEGGSKYKSEGVTLFKGREIKLIISLSNSKTPPAPLAEINPITASALINRYYEAKKAVLATVTETDYLLATELS